MSIFRSALVLILALGATHAIAEQITCESHGGRAEACGTVQPGSSVQMVEQLSNSPCIEGSSWGADNDSIWVSNGCRAVFSVQPRYSSVNNSYSDEDRNGYDPRRYDERSSYSDDRSSYSDRYAGSRYASDNTARNIANSACVNRVTSDQAIAEDEIGTNNVRRVSDDLFVVELSTPRGNIACSVDREGTVRAIDYRY